MKLLTFADVRAAIDREPNVGRRKLMITTYNHAAEALGWSPDGHIDGLLGDRSHDTCKMYCDTAAYQQLNYGTRNNRKSGFNQICRLAQSLAEEGKPNPILDEHPFHIELKKISLEKGIAHDDKAFRSYLTCKTLPDTERAVCHLAKRLNVSCDRLLQHVPFWKPEPLFDLRNPAYTWGAKVNRLRIEAYCLGELPSRLEESWRPFFEWRTVTSSSTLSTEHLDGSVHAIKRHGGWTYRDDQDQTGPTTSEEKIRSLVNSVYGFACLPRRRQTSSQQTDMMVNDESLYGLGIPVDDLRLAHFLRASTLNAYCDFQVRRNGKFDHSGLGSLVGLVSMLIGNDNSYACNAQAALATDFGDALGQDAPTKPQAWRDWVSGAVDSVSTEGGKSHPGAYRDQYFPEEATPEGRTEFHLRTRTSH